LKALTHIVSPDFIRIRSMVEKPKPEDAPSNLAAIGRYIFTPRIFSLLEGQQKGAGGEIQVTDAMVELLKEQPIFSTILLKTFNKKQET
jgi:UTP--glucose-1-phosphate uridylyltransferase